MSLVNEKKVAQATNEPLLIGLQLMEIACGEMAIFTSSEGRQSFQELLQTEEGRKELALKFDMLRQACQAKNASQFRKKVASLKGKAEQKKADNFATVYEQLKPVERRIRTLNLLYLNGGQKPNVFILPIDPNRFVGAANPSHFNVMKKWLRQRFFSYRMEGVVSYLGTTEIIKTKSQALQWATVAMNNKALFIGNIMEFTDYRKLVQYLQRRFKVTGIAPKFAHMVFPAVWGYVEGAYEDVGKEQRMSCPLGLAVLAKLLSVPPGGYISSLEKPPIDGIEGISLEYETETLDSLELEGLGVIMILDTGELQATNTANISDNIDLQEFPTVDLINAIDRALLKFTNAKAHSQWGQEQTEDLKETIEDFFAALAQAKLIQDPTPKVTIGYDEKEKTVVIHLDEVCYYRTATHFEITMRGKRNKGLQMEKKEA